MSLADKMSGKGKVVETTNTNKVIKVDTTVLEMLIEQRTKDIMAFVQKEIAKWNNLTFTTLEKAIAELTAIAKQKPSATVTNTTIEKPIEKEKIVTNIEKAFDGIENVPQYIPEVLDHIRKRIDISKVRKEDWITGFISAYSSIKGKVRGRPLGNDKLKDIANIIYGNIVATKETKTTTKEEIQGIAYFTKLFDLEKGELKSFIDGMLDSDVDISDLRTKEGRNFVLDQLGIECSIDDRKQFFAFLEKCIEENE